MAEAEVRERETERDLKMFSAGFEDGRSGHEPKKAGGLQKLEKTRKQILP